jgi:hypothetical protein
VLFAFRSVLRNLGVLVAFLTLRRARGFAAVTFFANCF